MDEKLLEVFNALGRSAAMQEAITKTQDNFQKNQEALQKQMSEMMMRDSLQEERLAQLEEVVNTLSPSVQDLGVAVARLKHVALGFVILLVIFAMLTGILSGETIPSIFSGVSAFLGL